MLTRFPTDAPPALPCALIADALHRRSLGVARVVLSSGYFPQSLARSETHPSVACTSRRSEVRRQEQNSAGSTRYACDVLLRRFRRSGRVKDTDVSIGDPRLDDWETVSTFEERATALAWRDRLRELGVDACCVADQPLDRFNRGDIYPVVAPDQWSRANDIVENFCD
jgi:hypothetical protein